MSCPVRSVSYPPLPPRVTRAGGTPIPLNVSATEEDVRPFSTSVSAACAHLSTCAAAIANTSLPTACPLVSPPPARLRPRREPREGAAGRRVPRDCGAPRQPQRDAAGVRRAAARCPESASSSGNCACSLIPAAAHPRKALQHVLRSAPVRSSCSEEDEEAEGAAHPGHQGV